MRRGSMGRLAGFLLAAAESLASATGNDWGLLESAGVSHTAVHAMQRCMQVSKSVHASELVIACR